MAWFFEFDEKSTLEEIRNFFSDREKCKGFVETHRKGGVFDAVAAFLLGGAKSSTRCTWNYCSIAYHKESNDASTWGQNVSTWTVGKGNSITPVNDLCRELSNNNNTTLKDVYDKLNEWDKWKSEDKKKKVLSLLNGSNMSDMQSGKVGSNNMNKNVNDIINAAIEANRQIIFTGAPGTGKTYSVREYVKHKCAILDTEGIEQTDEKGQLIVDEKQYKFIQFHPSYDYSDFVEGLRPIIIKGNDKNDPTFVRMDGVFKEFCRYIVEQNKEAEKKDYYFIVDEINRGDLAKIFGELMFGLEESYRGESNPIQTQYKNLVTYRIITENDAQKKPNLANDIGKAEPIENDVFEKGFYIPENLYFIGTMNDIDRSVDSMDFALRRRFKWIDVKANDIMKTSLHSIIDKDDKNYKKIDVLAENIIAMNKIISENNKFGLSDAYHIGPAYFKNLDINNDDSLHDIFDTNIVSILKEYTRGRKSEDVNTWIKECRKALLGEN